MRENTNVKSDLRMGKFEKTRELLDSTDLKK